VRALGPGPWRVRATALAAALAGASVLAACGSAPSSSAAAAQAGTQTGTQTGGVPPVSMATSLDTAGDSWALVPVSANPAFWQVFVRPVRSAAWRLVTPQGVADNGGLVAAGTGGSLTVAVRPSQNLTFSPLATTANGGTQWNTGLIDAGVAASPDALAASGGQLLALLADGTILASSDAGATWRTLAGPGSIAGSPAGRKCGTVGVTGVSFGITGGQVLAAGTCGATGATVFAHSASGWQRLTLPVSGRVVRMLPGLVLVASGSRLYATWDTVAGWPVSSALPADGVVAAGTLGPGGAWVLRPGRRAATIAGPGQLWRSLPAVPAGTVALAAGPGGAVDALAVSGSNVTVWRLAGAATVWSNIQKIGVPVQYGSSS
jgi:hypothetical protein